MSAQPVIDSGEERARVAWRLERLLSAGFDRELAARIAAGRGVDLHMLLELVDRGCPPRLAWRITAPLDREP
ncbi:MAG TPA: hypothetical protein VH391_04110 [Solirubrobacterales bacterium]